MLQKQHKNIEKNLVSDLIQSQNRALTSLVIILPYIYVWEQTPQCWIQFGLGAKPPAIFYILVLILAKKEIRFWFSALQNFAYGGRRCYAHRHYAFMTNFFRASGNMNLSGFHHLRSFGFRSQICYFATGVSIDIEQVQVYEQVNMCV